MFGLDLRKGRWQGEGGAGRETCLPRWEGGGLRGGEGGAKGWRKRGYQRGGDARDSIHNHYKFQLSAV